ncbi:MAG: DUF1217 domain-containing protein [Alphaproteobacteria bacterium]|nr:DUF1217 domain-containing protein [Alphaproteobacteria bacterium]
MALVSGTGLTTLFGGTNASSNLLTTLYGGGGTPGGSPLVALKMAQKNRDREVANTAKQPETQRDIAVFKRVIAKAKTIGEALDNPAVMKVLLTANGLADQVPYAGLAKKVLLSDPNDPNALVNRMGSARWKSVVKAFDFAKAGIDALKDPALQTRLADGYVEVAWRKGLEKATPGLSDALDFRERASKFKNAIDILGDPVMRRVVTTALGIPKQIAFQELGAQEKAITNRLDISRLQDPKFVDGLSQRYLLEKQKEAPAPAPDLSALSLQLRGIIA